MKRSSVALALLGSLFLIDRAGAACAMGQIADLPVTMASTRPVVSAKINGTDVTFLADSGAFFSSITPANASELHLSLSPAPSNFRVCGVTGDVSIFLTRVNELTLAGKPIQHVEFLVGGGEAGAGAVGLLGENVLGFADAEYDLANGVIRLLETRGCGATNLAYWDTTQSSSVIDLDWPKFNSRLTPSPKITAFVNGQRIRVLLDTGSSTSILSLRAAGYAGLSPQTPGAVVGGYIGGVGKGFVQDWIVPVASFKIGDEEIKNTKLRIGAIQIDGADMLLGADFFVSHHIFVGNNEHKLYFTYNGGPVFNLASTASGEPSAKPPPASNH